jgi:predicted DCC family thiol-disulfide oxidoreductase YuxK
MSSNALPGKEDLLLYDGECPFCSNYVGLIALRKQSPNFRVLDACREPALCRALAAEGHDIDEGMILKWRGEIYYGSDAIHVLSLITHNIGLSGRLNRWIFRSRKRARLLYPFLRRGRNAVLRILGRRPIRPTMAE